MKIKTYLSLALIATSSLAAAPLSSTTAVHVRPEAASPVIAVLNAGTEPTPAVGIAHALPSGWSAVELTGPREAYIANRDMDKELEVRPGSAFRTLPKADGPILTKMEPGDQYQVTEYHGKFTQVRINKKIVGYIQGWSGGGSSRLAGNSPAAPRSGAPATASAATSAPAPARTANAPVNAPFSPAPAAPAAMAGGGGHPVQMVDLGDGGSDSLPRLFQGKLVSTRSLLHPRRPYDFQLNDTGGQRYGYVDVRRLLQTEQIEKYIDHVVTVYGTAKPVAGTKDMVIEAESLQLK